MVKAFAVAYVLTPKLRYCIFIYINTYYCYVCCTITDDKVTFYSLQVVSVVWDVGVYFNTRCYVGKCWYISGFFWYVAVDRRHTSVSDDWTPARLCTSCVWPRARGPSAPVAAVWCTGTRDDAQRRNFGLKSGGTNSEWERSIIGYRGERRGKCGGSIPLLIWLLGLGERQYELSQRGPWPSPGRKWFYCNLNSADRLCWQQVTANSSPFRPEKWGYGTPQSKKWGYRYPS